MARERQAALRRALAEPDQKETPAGERAEGTAPGGRPYGMDCMRRGEDHVFMEVSYTQSQGAVLSALGAVV